jgi:hypothetical protein
VYGRNEYSSIPHKTTTTLPDMTLQNFISSDPPPTHNPQPTTSPSHSLPHKQKEANKKPSSCTLANQPAPDCTPTCTPPKASASMDQNICNILHIQNHQDRSKRVPKGPSHTHNHRSIKDNKRKELIRKGKN